MGASCWGCSSGVVPPCALLAAATESGGGREEMSPWPWIAKSTTYVLNRGVVR
jgi:hypothetical protein